EANTYTRNSVLDGSPTKENGKKQKQTQAAINALATEARTIQDPDQMEANEKAKGELEMSLVKDVEQQHKVWDKFSQEETSTYLQLKKDAEGFMNAAESATNPEAKQILEAKADEKIEAADKMYDTVENWDGLMTKADKIEAANKAAEVANPGAVQDHVYGLRPTSTESKIRTEKAKSRKDLDLSIAKIDTDFKTKTEALDKKMSPSDTKIYSSGTLNSERESKELATLHREHVKFKESNERKSDVVFHDEQIPTDAKFKQGEEVGGLQHKRKPKYSPGPLNPNYIKDNKTADKLGEGGYDLNEERGRQISGGKYWRSQSQPTITMPIVDRLTGEIVTEQQMIKNDEAKKRLDSEFKKAEERAAKAKERDHKEFTKSKKRLKNQATADKERARLDSANRNDIAAIQEMNKEGRTGKAEKAGIELMKRNKTLIDWAARNVANWYSPPKTIEEQGGVQIANDINTFKGSKGVKKQYSKKKTTKTEDGSYDTQEVGFTVDGIRDLVMQEALKNVLTFNPDAGVAASTHVFSTNKLVQKVKQQINAEGKVKSSVGRGKSVIYNKQAISDLKEAIGELKEEKAANPESSYLYDDIIKSYQNEVFALENVTPYTHDVDAGFNNPNKADLDAVSDEQSTFIDNYEGVDAALGINPKDSAKMLKYVRSTIESGGLPSISSLIEDSQLDITNTGNEQADADVGAREGKSLDQANLNYADAIRKANPALSKLVNSYVNDLMNTAEDIQLNSATIYDLLPRTIAGKDSKAFNGFFNGVRGSKQAAALPWEGQFEGLKGNHRSTMKLRDAVANAVVDSMVDAVVEANPNIELSVSPSQPGKTPLRPIVSWMNSMMAKTGQKVIISDKIVDQWNEVLAPEARLNGLISKNTGEIYVRSTVGPETVIHEMGHAWAT
ncbi:MAG: hypothetical protein K0U78_18190, partial [Actinomycetia bacterium]|nr:hypothetical protein [Actinomycetes bacterium]